MDLKDTIGILLKIFKLFLNIRLHETKTPTPDKPCIPDKIFTTMWYVPTVFLQITKNYNDRDEPDVRMRAVPRN